MKRIRLIACLALVSPLLGCRNEDAYLGGSHQAYQCGAFCQVEQGAPGDSGDWFFNPEADLGDAPEILYPLDGAVHPIDLRKLTVQFRRGRDDFEVFRIRVSGPDVVYEFFTRCLSVHDDGCRYVLQGATWNAARAALVDKPAALTVAGATGLHGVVKTSTPIAMSVVESQLSNKGFYYWTTIPQYSDDSGLASLTGIFRLPFGADQSEPFIMPNTRTNDRQCGACHSVSSDGSTIAFTARDDTNDPDQRTGTLVAKLTASPDTPLISPGPPGTYDSSMMALNSTGKRVLVAQANQLVLRSSEMTSTLNPGDVIATLTEKELGGKNGYFPEFSPNDDAVVLTLSSEPDSAIAVRAGDIAVMSFNLFNNSFGEPEVIVPSTPEEFHFYPTWSPDGEFIAFASAPHGDGEDGNPRKSYDQKEARLRLVRRTGGTVYELTNATHELHKWSTYPKFAPFKTGQKDRQLMFLTFNSKINYGLVLDNAAKANDSDRVAQLWMSAIDVGKLPDDPSSAPIWLPFQDPTQPGHLGLWTKEVQCRTDLGGTGCGFNEECVEKTCVVIPK